MRWNGQLLATLPSVAEDMVGSVNITNLDGGFSIVDQSDQLRIVKKCLEDSKIDIKSYGLKPLNVINAIGRIKEEK